MRYSYAPGSVAAHDRAVAELGAGRAAPVPEYTILRRAQLYDLTTPGTPTGLLQVARAAEEGASLPAPGGWRYVATFALAADRDGGVVASLALRLCGDLPGRPRRAWVVYVRTGAGGWQPRGAALLDHGDAEHPVRPVGVLELRATLRGEVYVPPPPRPGPPRMRCFTCDKLTPFSTNTWKPYARHRCETKQQEGRS